MLVICFHLSLRSASHALSAQIDSKLSFVLMMNGKQFFLGYLLYLLEGQDGIHASPWGFDVVGKAVMDRHWLLRHIGVGIYVVVVAGVAADG